MIRILAVGKKHDDWVLSGLERYEKRLKAPYNVEWVLLPHSSREGVEAREEESGRILKQIKPNDFVVLLDETGKQLTSPALSNLCEARFVLAEQLVFVIGGAYGVDNLLQQRANLVWSLSDLVFPHQLVRLILIEQLYRAQQIARGNGYHHE
ncbi:TPA: 50S rRNA methyltransferase [Candidatus Saccharibacteria bacterium]|nr:50S rRNA methyltransferase [Candidatus Saccharibacteria bacterium]HRF28077.1 23S rRNA (pseudouridine(1915)-N(3))-methyltransferase RlmH [Candidatus Saccharibacteria bacterium]HRJ91378.1 23S rRNA (pseudouridine(1915)-N(3))-methyltransferase RlmH [Candidatus Saccharibacteria bacterium]